MNDILTQKKTHQRLVVRKIFLAVLIFITIIGLIKINQNAALIISAILFLIIILTPEIKVQITDKSIIFYDERLIKFLSSKHEILFDNIDHIDFFPAKYNFLGLFSDVVFAENNAKLDIFLTNGRIEKKNLSYHDKGFNEKIVIELKKHRKINVASS
ncbi:MAG: hypothetical protein JXL97_03755 [Bacteroidales bacterium]|nr:hypothetical protein [Bacteroidales bacterium]